MFLLKIIGFLYLSFFCLWTVMEITVEFKDVLQSKENFRKSFREWAVVCGVGAIVVPLVVVGYWSFYKMFSIIFSF